MRSRGERRRGGASEREVRAPEERVRCESSGGAREKGVRLRRSEREREAKAQRERERGVKAQRERERGVKAQEEREKEATAQEEVREVATATQERCVEKKKEMNSTREENDVSNRHMTWWRSAWWIHMRTARDRRRIWRAARRAAEQGRGNPEPSRRGRG